jgi:hypothetical protein
LPQFTGPLCLGAQEPDDALDQIGHVAEAPRLRAVAVDRHRLAAQSLRDEVRDDAPVVQPHPRAVRVEDAHDPGLDAVRAVIRHRERLREALRLVVDAAFEAPEG